MHRDWEPTVFGKILVLLLGLALTPFFIAAGALWVYYCVAVIGWLIGGIGAL